MDNVSHAICLFNGRALACSASGGRLTMRRFAIVAACAGLAGCTTATAPSSNTSAVTVVSSPGGVEGCKFVTNVRGDQNLYGGFLFAQAAYNDAIRQMKEKTVAAGGNRLYIALGSTGMMGANLVGDAYRC